MEDVICSMCGPGVPCSCGKVKDNPTVKSSLYEGYPPILGTIGIPNMKVDNKLKAIELAIEFGKLLGGIDTAGKLIENSLVIQSYLDGDHDEA
jgi:hypothetical protein|tara:strand:+ start:1108 stop:1386 length:279 start_codon:yes stop_codon:yes gene_type:complete